MKRLCFALTLALFALRAEATNITGNLAIAGLDTYTGSSITFHDPGTVLLATGSLNVMSPPTITPLNLINEPTFLAEAGKELFSWTQNGVTITMTTDTFIVNNDNAFFLNVLGKATLTETGFSPTPYNFSLASTRPDGTTSYTLDVTQIPAVGEPSSLVLLGTGLLSMALLYWSRKRINFPRRGEKGGVLIEDSEL